MVPAARGKEMGDILTLLNFDFDSVAKNSFSQKFQLLIHININLSLKLFV